MADTKFLKMALGNGGITYDQAQYWYRSGLLDDTDWMIYQFIWRNSAPRFSDIAQRYDLKG